LKYRPEIDGLRAIAVLPVILFHAKFSAFAGGFVGVDIFFVISGYLITSLLLEDLSQGQFSIITFYERRARRILPAMTVMIVACIPFAWVWMLPDQFEGFFRSIIATNLFVSNFYFWSESGYFATASETKPLLHTWSLSVEEQFYIVFPIFLFVLSRLKNSQIFLVFFAIFLLSFLCSLWAAVHFPSLNFYSTPTRVWELLAGSLCALVTKNFSKVTNDAGSILGMVLILFSIFVFSENTPFPSEYTLLPVLGTVAVILFAKTGTIVHGFLSLKLFGGIGLISYSLYLWHQPIFAFVRIRSIYEPSNLSVLLMISGVFFISYLSWKFIEKPFRTKGRAGYSITRNQIFISSGVTILLLCGVSMAILDTKLARERLSPSVLSLLEDQSSSDISPEGCLKDAKDFDINFALENCSNSVSGKGRVVLLGDSHASHYGKVLSQHFEEYGIPFSQLTTGACPPFRGLKAADRNCDQSLEKIENYIQKNEIRNLLISARWSFHTSGQRFDNEEGGVEGGGVRAFLIEGYRIGSTNYQKEIARIFRDGIKDYLERGYNVVLVYPSPEAGWNVPNTLAQLKVYGGEEPQELSTSFDVFESRHKVIEEAFDEISDDRLRRVRPSDLLCDKVIPNRCINTVAGMPIYADDDHFSRRGSELVAEEIIEKFSSLSNISNRN